MAINQIHINTLTGEVIRSNIAVNFNTIELSLINKSEEFLLTTQELSLVPLLTQVLSLYGLWIEIYRVSFTKWVITNGRCSIPWKRIVGAICLS